MTNQTATNRAVQDIYPLSPTQQGLLFHSLYGESQTGAYIVQVSFTLKGDLNREAFEQAWQQLMRRHTILRTAFVWDNLAAPVQVVGQKASLPICWHSWEHLSTQEKQAQQQENLAALIESDRTQGFNLSNAPLMRINAIQLGPNHYRIIWTHHHILLDGWSLPILLKEWIAYYQAAATKKTVQLGEPYPYRDYIAWLQQQDLSAAKQFWQDQLSGITAPTPLGIDNSGQKEVGQRDKQRNRSQQNGSQQNYDQRSYCLPAELTQQLKNFAQQNRLTLSSLVQGAWAKVLSVYSNESTVLYGLARAGRPDSLPQAHQRVGLFINTLPMRVTVSNNSDLVPWLQDIQTQQLTQQPYEYTPLVDIQAVSNIPRQSPLFESVVVFENYPLESAEGLGGLDLLDVAITEQTHYPLTLFATASETLNFKMLYDMQRFEVGAIARLLGHLHSTLAAIVANAQPTNAQKSIGSISILSASEQEQLIHYGQGASVKVSDQCIKDAVAQHAYENPTATALLFEGDAISYSQLDSRANQLVHYLRQQGIEPNTVIGLCAERSVEMVIALLAILKLGCAYVPLDPTHPADRLQYVVEDAGINWLICHAATAQILKPGEIQQINMGQVASAIANQPTSALNVTVAPTNIAYLIYTSGSTGRPKGVPITHQSLNNLLRAMITRLQVTPADTLMAVTTFAFDIAALELFLPLVSGACLLLANNETVRDGHRLIADLETYGVDIMQATPATWRLLLSSGWTGQNGLKILCGGEALDSSLAKVLLDCGEEVWNVYGPTETTIWSGALALTKDLIEAGNVPIGHPIDNTHFYVLDEQQQPVPIGVAGELYIGGLGLSQGYWNRPELTAEKFVPVDGNVLYRTGDRVRYREDGTLDYLGRFDYQAKLRGYRIELGEIESAMARPFQRKIALHPHINQAIAVLQGDTAEDQRLVAYVTLDNGKEANELQFSVGDALRTHLTRQLPHYMVPTAYQVLPAFPLTPNGKVDRKALPAITQSAITPDARPKTAIENTLAEIWRSILPVQEEAEKAVVGATISIYDNFFEIGGHSLLVINAQSQIRQQLGIELSMVDLFRYPTLNTLATHIDQLNEKGEKDKEKQEERKAAVAAGKQRLNKRLKQRKSAQQLGGKAT